MIELVLLAHAVLICVGLCAWFAFRNEPGGSAAAGGLGRGGGAPRSAGVLGRCSHIRDALRAADEEATPIEPVAVHCDPRQV